MWIRFTPASTGVCKKYLQEGIRHSEKYYCHLHSLRASAFIWCRRLHHSLAGRGCLVEVMNQYIFQLPRLHSVSSPEMDVSPGPASCCWLLCPPPAETTPSSTSPTFFIQLVLPILHFPTLPNSTAEVTLTDYTRDSSSASPEIATHNSTALDLNQEQHTSQNHSLTHVLCIINRPSTRLVASNS